MTKLKELKSKIDKLSPGVIKDLDMFVESLLKSKLDSKKLQQNWAGGLKNFRKQYTSLELQKKALEWRKN